MCSTCGCSKKAESADPNKTTTSINAKFFVGKGDDNKLLGKGKFMKYNDAVAKAKEVAQKEGKSRVVSNRGFALWTHDGQGLFQEGKSTAEAKKYYRAEDGSIDMNAYADDYSDAEEGFFEAESKFDKLSDEIAAQYRKKGKSSAEAERIGKATAYKIGVRKYGKEGMTRRARRGMRAESFEAEGMRSMTPLVTLGLIGAGVLLASKMRTNMEKKESQSGGCGCHGKDHSDQEKRAEGLPVQNVESGIAQESFGDVGEGNDFGQKRAESYPQTFDRAQDFLPRYRYPEDSDWSNDYNPADPFRPLDYQRVQTKRNK